MDETPSVRLVEQRLRNRLMESLRSLVDWREDLPGWGPGEYFESFFDIAPYKGLDPNSAVTPEEREALEAVRCMMVEACDATPRQVTTEALIAAGWPERIEPLARAALDLFERRGRFSEEREEGEPGEVASTEPMAARE